eukprot:9186115-Pyramimonas_sp.AAC.1
MKESTLGNGIIQYPSKHNGLCKAPGYGILNLIPTKHEFFPENAQYIPHWLSQRKDGDAPPIRA